MRLKRIRFPYSIASGDQSAAGVPLSGVAPQACSMGRHAARVKASPGSGCTGRVIHSKRRLMLSSLRRWSAKRTFRKWYFAANVAALRDSFDQIEVAVQSARLRTSLLPVCLVDATGDLATVADRLHWLEAAGVRLVRHSAALFAIVRAHFGADADIFSGHWLRCDIPLIETEDEFVLYTDIDVMFRRDVAKVKVRPRLLACAPEFDRKDLGYFNSGVMVMNLPALRARRPDLIAHLRERLTNMRPYDDQGALNATFRHEWDRLPDSWNWKPYWGMNDDAAIVHFHGPKPFHVDLLRRAEDPPDFPSDFARLYRLDPAAYAGFMDEFEATRATLREVRANA